MKKRLMGWLWLGVIIDFAGIVWDGLYHAFNPEIDIETIPVPHWPLIIGPVLTFYIAIQLVRKEGYTYKWLTYLILTFSTILFIGTLWDNFIYHIRGIEPEEWALPHIFVKVGTFGSLLSAIIFSIGTIFYRWGKKRKELKGGHLTTG